MAVLPVQELFEAGWCAKEILIGQADEANVQKLFSEAGFDPATCGLWAHHSTSEPLRTLRQTASSGMTRIRCFDPAFSAVYIPPQLT